MCYDDNARPPIPPGEAGEAHGEDLVLTSADGTQFAAYVARSANPGTAQVIIYPDVRGLHQFYKELALRFAQVGINAIAVDYFGRTAGLTSRDDSFEFWPHVQQLSIDGFEQDVKAALEYLHSNVGQGAVFPVGFCMGGSLTFITGTNKDFGFAGLIAFYSGLTRAFGGRGTVLDQAEKVSYPALAMFGEADEGIPASAREELDQKLNQAGVEHTIITYPGAPHSFFDRRAEQYAEASSDAWKQVLGFISSHS
jgi:carboxymethylenebutenolidase